MDCYRNKAQAVKLATHEWVILFDSDNIIYPAYLDALYALPQWNTSVAYCPDFAEPSFDYSMFAGVEVHAGNISAFMGKESNRVPFDRASVRRRGQPRLILSPLHSRFRTALNTCNYFVHREEYLEVWDGSVDPHTADSIYQNLNWLKSGRRLMIVKGLRYFHRVHQDSHYKNNWKKTGNFHKEVETQLMAMR